MCLVETFKKVDCKHGSQIECENANCCWQPSPQPQPWCYYPKDHFSLDSDCPCNIWDGILTCDMNSIKTFPDDVIKKCAFLVPALNHGHTPLNTVDLSGQNLVTIGTVTNVFPKAQIKHLGKRITR